MGLVMAQLTRAYGCHPRHKGKIRSKIDNEGKQRRNLRYKYFLAFFTQSKIHFTKVKPSEYKCESEHRTGGKPHLSTTILYPFLKEIFLVKY